ncbi:HAD family hydrolase [Halotia branconii]|uniref:HAD family hydrolase n=1 Tax=Halotia branconii CENA392 TaxID=1539056 RepID=A0AAJ6NQH6_9CYAN|nr:HAD family hydrolase [Halotia branconii]WGV24740.1 HAD family hydrolase [Halotia branconii CENA392]
MAFEGVILDIDGTLVLSNDAHAQSWVEAFANYGYEIPFEQVRPLMGMGGDHVIPKLVPELNNKEGTGKAIASHRKELILNKFVSQLKGAPGSRDLVLKMQESGLHLVVASSASYEELDILLKIAQVDDLLQELTSSDDAQASKPASDIIEAALKKAQMPPEKLVMLGDTPYDIESAGKVGVSVIAMRCGGFSDEQLSGALAIYDDPSDLLRNYDSSVLASK